MKKNYFVLVSIVLVALPLVASAIEYPFGNIKGNSPAEYIHALYVWGLGIVGALAVVSIAYGGFMYMVGKVDDGKDIITQALLGLLLLFGAWLILYTINPDLATLKDPVLTQQTNNFKEAGVDEQNKSLLAANALTPSNPSLTSNGTVSQNTTNYVKNATNLNGVDQARAAAIIQAESSGDPNAVHTDIDGKSSYGLMQIRVGTARYLDPTGTQNLSDSEVAAKLTSDPNYNINLGTKYYSDLLNEYGDPTLAHAAYNGGPTANDPSVDCPGQRRWQCVWDDTAQTVPNTGYAPTRTYIVNINKYVASYKP